MTSRALVLVGGAALILVALTVLVTVAVVGVGAGGRPPRRADVEVRDLVPKLLVHPRRFYPGRGYGCCH